MDRINKLCRAFMDRLPPGYRECIAEPDMGFALAISRSAGFGERLPSGKKHELVGGITMNQLRVIANTSDTDEIGVQRIYDLIIHGKDTTQRPESQLISVDQVDQIVRERVAALLQSAQEAKARSEQSAQEAKPAAPDPEQSTAESEEVAIWTQRAKILGIKRPLMSKARPGAIDGRWMRNASKLWDEHEQPTAAQ